MAASEAAMESMPIFPIALLACLALYYTYRMRGSLK
jgi:hypothetical protein